MKNLQQVREGINRLTAEAEAIVNLAKSENREPTADETSRIDAILGAGDKPGELASHRVEEARALKLENMTAEILARRQSPANGQVIAPDGSQKTRVEISASVRRPAVLNLGKGVMNRVEQEEHAYGFGKYIMAALFGDAKSREWCEAHGMPIRNAMSEGWDSKGGVLVPEEYEASLIRLVNEYGVARRELQTWPMSSDTKVVPRRTGGLTTYYPAEGGTITASDPTLDKVQLTARKLACLARHSVELNEDSVISLGDMLGLEAALAIANAEDSACFNGDATSTYGRIVGLKNALTSGSEYTAATGNTAFATLDLDDFEGMLALVQSYAMKFGNAKWYIHRAGWAASMQRLAAAAGGNTVQNIVNGVPMNFFLGYPVVFVEVMNSTLTAQTSTEGLCYFGDLRQTCAFGDRRGIAMAISNDVYFTTEETAIRWSSRYDINIHDVGAAGGASGGVVQLLTPGS